ncbi:MAG: cell division protein FtsW [Pseudonocardiales bacterium]|jgi:cell division protein FtsW|nr:cell division protein FtsW [Pseudonocardiales bacterium]
MINRLRDRVSGIRVVRASGRYLEGPYASVQLMLAAGGGLLFFGLLMSASTTLAASVHTTGDAPWAQLIREVQFIVLSVPVFWLAVRMSPAAYRRVAYPALGIALCALVGVLVPGIGVTVNGAHRWIQLGPLTVQPSEFAKFAILLWGADLLARKESLRTLTTARHVLVPLVPGFVMVIGLVMLEPDLGTSLCFMLVLLGLLWMVGLPYRYFAGLLLAVAGVVMALAVTEAYRMERLTTFLHPNLDPEGAGYHTIQGLYALSSGGVFGVGLGQGTSKYGWVPNANTDYVFAIVGEELGLLGCVVVLGLFALFTYAAMRIAHRSQDPFVRLVGSGAAIWIAGQALINVGYVTALLPVTGIPLPFISNGGTSLVLTCAVLGMLVSFARHEPSAARAAQQAAADGSTARWIRALRLGTPRVGTPRRSSTARQGGITSAGDPGTSAAAPARPLATPTPAKPVAVPVAGGPAKRGAAAGTLGGRQSGRTASPPAGARAAAPKRSAPAGRGQPAPHRPAGQSATRRKGA